MDLVMNVGQGDSSRGGKSTLRHWADSRSPGDSLHNIQQWHLELIQIEANANELS